MAAPGGEAPNSEVDFGKLTGSLRRLDDFDEFARYALLSLDRTG